MNDEQKKAYQLVREACHDEKHTCTNLAMLVRTMFPEDPHNPDDTLTLAMNKVIGPYLDVRSDLGQNVMDILYELEKDGLT